MTDENKVPEGRVMKRGDSFVTINTVDVGVSLFTLGFPFYDPVNPYLQQSIGGERSVRFLFEKKSKFEVGKISHILNAWSEAHNYNPPMEAISVCKRTIWERRNTLSESRDVAFNGLQGSPKEDEVIVDDLRLAAVCYALGFRKPKHYLVPNDKGCSYIVGTRVPNWLTEACPQCVTFDDIKIINQEGLDYVSKEGNEIDPIAIAIASFINIAAWVKHLSSTKPYNKFVFPNGQKLLVKEDSPRWHELTSQGYAPE